MAPLSIFSLSGFSYQTLLPQTLLPNAISRASIIAMFEKCSIVNPLFVTFPYLS